MQAWRVDIDVRTNGMEKRSRTGLEVEPHEIMPGIVYEDANVKVTAFRTRTGSWRDVRLSLRSRGKIDCHLRRHEPERGADSALSEVDVLIHEAYSDAYRPADMANWLEYRSTYHTTTTQLGQLAAERTPGLVIIHHRGVGVGAREISEDQYIAEVHRGWSGRVVVGHDLDVY